VQLTFEPRTTIWIADHVMLSWRSIGVMLQATAGCLRCRRVYLPSGQHQHREVAHTKYPHLELMVSMLPLSCHDHGSKNHGLIRKLSH